MRVLFSPMGAVVDSRYPSQGIIDIKNGGFDEIVYDARLAIDKLEVTYPDRYRKYAEAEGKPFVLDKPEKFVDRMRPFSNELVKRNVNAPVMYAPVLYREIKSTKFNEVYMRIVSESVKLAVEEKCECVIVRPIYAGIGLKEEWEINKNFYMSLYPLVRGTGIKILLQNQCKDVEGHFVRGMMADANMAIEWVSELNKEADGIFGFCLDVGACNLCGVDIYEMITTLGDYIDAVVISDNDGHQDECIMPFTSVSRDMLTTDWLSVIRGLRDIAYDRFLIFDISSTLKAISPILRPDYMMLARKTADFILWQMNIENNLKKYKNIVLFGAGNMCRNYLINYGDKYPPLYTCDNNSSRWGSDFFGLTIHDPRDLLNLSDDTGIFICNTYYRDIKDQLETMGVSAGIEYFSDEYLPNINMKYMRGI